MRATFNNDDGVNVTSYGSLIKDCSAFYNGGNGINVFSGSTVTGNTVNSNQTNGIVTFSGCTIIGNTATASMYCGIDPGDYSLIDQNTAYGNNISYSCANIDACATCTWGINVNVNP